jgi:hypothetical protein
MSLNTTTSFSALKTGKNKVNPRGGKKAGLVPGEIRPMRVAFTFLETWPIATIGA